MSSFIGPIERIVILTGAGISAESGIRTFRGADGLWENHRLEDVATPEAWHRDPALVQRFYNERRQRLLEADITPNLAHQALARLEETFAGHVLLVTQNIDNLHERGGSRNIIHMHGELFKARCTRSGKVVEVKANLDTHEPCQCCHPPGRLRPHVVWFGEIPLQMDEIQQALSCCDLFVSIGTSGNVYPAAGFVEMANHAGAHSLELNLEPSQVHTAFHEHRTGLASELVPLWVDEILEQTGSNKR